MNIPENWNELSQQEQDALLANNLTSLLEDTTGRKANSEEKDEPMTTEAAPAAASFNAPAAPDKIPHHEVSAGQFNAHGKKIRSMLEMLEPNPVVLISPPGSGKTKMFEIMARDMNYRRIGVMFNAQAAAKIVWGNFYPPRNASDKQLLEWIDSRMVAAMRPEPGCTWTEGQPRSACSCQKTMIHIDEFNRQDEDVQVRWLTVLEDTGRWLHLVEHHQEEFAIHPNIWVVGTMNPENQSASINPIEPALLDRLRVIEVQKPIVNEEKVLSEILPQFPADIPKLLVRMATDSRKNPDTAISTRALVMIAKSMVYGLKLNEAIKVNVLNTTIHRDNWHTVDSLFNAFFGDREGFKGTAPSRLGV